MPPRKPSPLVWLIGGAALLAAGSLYTPYPAQLVRALKGLPEDDGAVSTPLSDEPGDRPSEGHPSEQPDKPLVHRIPAGSVTPWKPQANFTMPAIVLPPFPPALPQKISTGEFVNVTELIRGINLKTKVNFIPGTTATRDRKKPESYRATFSLDIVVPKAAKGEDLKLANPELPNVLKEYDALLAGAQTSPYYSQLYQNKENRIRNSASSLLKIIDRHNFYDTDTILEITHPQTRRKVLWLQSDMDVVSDGTDGDRLPKMPDAIVNSSTYQPFTTYAWKKRTKQPNPLLASWESKLKTAEASLKKATGTSRTALQERIRTLKLEITDLKTKSYLIAEYDPFIVIPLRVINQSNSDFSPKAGDYAVVVHENRLFPAIVGDAGPHYKTGEASLRLAKEVNPKATIYSRPVSDLSTSYLVFPGTAEPDKGPIDYDRLNARCRELLDEIGGIHETARYHQWEDLLKPKPEPLPTPPVDKPGNGKPEQTDPAKTDTPSPVPASIPGTADTPSEPQPQQPPVQPTWPEGTNGASASPARP